MADNGHKQNVEKTQETAECDLYEITPQSSVYLTSSWNVSSIMHVLTTELMS